MDLYITTKIFNNLDKNKITHKYDYLIVGAGLFGSILARELTDNGYSCLVIDRREHLGGNCYTENVDSINVHKYGPHIFHTNKDDILNYIKKYTTINNFSCRPKLKHGKNVYSFPINLMTLNQLWGVTTPQEAKKKIDKVTKKYKKKYPEPRNSYEWGLSNVGKEIFDIFYKPYLEKQWNKDTKDIPASVLQRQVIRMDYNDSYYYDKYQGILDYTMLFDNLLKDIDIELNVDYLKNKSKYDNICNNIIYSGAIDEFYNYKFGALEYRSLKFETERLELKDYQGVFMVSYPENKYDFTRIIEHKHFDFGEQDFTIITKEYPDNWEIGKNAYYPVNDDSNQVIYNMYYEYSKKDTNVIFGGRLGSYKYLNMDDTVERALEILKKIINR